MPDGENIQPKKKISWRLWLLAPVIVVLLLLKAYNTWYWPSATVRVGEHSVYVLVSNTYQHNVKGLSGRKTLKQYDGMVFYFPDRAQHTMVMRDMLFPIDIVWVDRGVVVDIAQNLAPEPGLTEAQLTPYFARLPSTMVLELEAGKVDEYGIKVGDTVIVGK